MVLNHPQHIVEERVFEIPAHSYHPPTTMIVTINPDGSRSMIIHYD